MPDSVTIYQPWGGVGDNMAHSIIPELCHELGIKCFLSKQNAYRNTNIHDFVWKRNSFITDYKEGTDMTWYQKLAEVSKPGMNHIEAIQKAYGLPVKYYYPKIYYTPQKIEELTNKTVVDLSAYTAGKEYKKEKLIEIVKGFNLDKQTVMITHKNVNYGTRYEINFEPYCVNSLEHYSDVIFSCKRFITLHSGQACLASTIKHQTEIDLDIFVLTLSKYLPENNVGYTFINTNYIACD